MHIDARTIDNNSVIEGDICIVGTGAAGISMALQWVNTPYKVILLEGGGFEYDDKVQELYNGKILGHAYYPMKSSRLHYFGGTTGHWGGMCSTFDEIDFKKRDWVDNSGWPITLQDIAPYYEKASAILDLGANQWNTAYWQQQNNDLKPLPLDEKIAWSKIWQFSPPTRFGAKYKEEILAAKNIHLYTYANAVNIEAVENVTTVNGITIKNYAGKQHTVKAKYYILACCSVQNSRLLLASNKQATKGIGNDNDVVGRYFMEHPETKTGELWLNDNSPLHLYKFGGKTRAEIAIQPDVQEAFKILNGTIALSPLEVFKKQIPAVKTWQQNDPRRSLDTFGSYAGKASRKNIFQRLIATDNYQAYGFLTRIEQTPNPLSRVTLSSEKDELGVPRADLNWQMTALDKRSVRKINELIGQQVGKAGIGRVKLADFLLDEKDESMPDDTSGGWHHMGTTRMSDNPKTGVVDADCKVFGINNLYIAGSSCFATGGAVNPTLTVVAISLRLTEHLKGKTMAATV
jgi:choline dehydrogenase-like flavoprotein